MQLGDQYFIHKLDTSILFFFSTASINQFISSGNNTFTNFRQYRHTVFFVLSYSNSPAEMVSGCSQLKKCIPFLRWQNHWHLQRWDCPYIIFISVSRNSFRYAWRYSISWKFRNELWHFASIQWIQFDWSYFIIFHLSVSKNPFL